MASHPHTCFNPGSSSELQCLCPQKQIVQEKMKSTQAEHLDTASDNPNLRSQVGWLSWHGDCDCERLQPVHRGESEAKRAQLAFNLETNQDARLTVN